MVEYKVLFFKTC